VNRPRTAAFVTVPAVGHLNPTLPIVSRLVEGGDRVVYFAPAPFQAAIERAGGEFCPLAVPADPIRSKRRCSERLLLLLHSLLDLRHADLADRLTH
jgi:UDP:flavonoid glycosyltransferase YjiC (YdhE family)